MDRRPENRRQTTGNTKNKEKEKSMDIMEATEQLGRAIKESELYRRFESAKSAYESDETLMGYLGEYQADKETLERAGKMEDVDTHLLDILNERIEELYKLITVNPIYLEYVSAQEAVNKLMEEVNIKITHTITGRMPCSHGCADCNSCHHE